jgi:copper homeostasis protein
MRIEICVDSVEGALAAEAGGADRVELCDNLMEGGTTPSLGCIRLLKAQLGIGLHVMIRPRGGDFLYSDLELEVMREDIRLAKEAGADAVVFGCLSREGDIDVGRCKELLELARPMKVTFHRAFDMCRDASAGLDALMDLGVDWLLTSGQEATCLEGSETLAALVRQAAGRIGVMAGGGITPRNVRRIVELTGVTEVHLSARQGVESAMSYRNVRCFMGGTLRPPEFSRKTTQAAIVQSAAAALK